MNSNTVAVYFNDLVIYWSSVMIFCGALAFITMTFALWKPKNPRSAALGCFFPLAILFSFLFSRLIHWYFNMEQYAESFGASTFSSIVPAFTRFSVGSYCLPGVILGICFAAWIVSKLGYVTSAGRLLDFAAPGTCLLIFFIRLSALFNGSFIGKRPVTGISFLQRLPFCVTVTDTAGNVSYRPAVFFLEALLILIAFVALLSFFYNYRTVKMYYPCRSTGNVWKMFLISYAAIEILTDSLRTDKPLMHFTFLNKLNAYSAFISIAQVAALAFLLIVFFSYYVCSIRTNGFRWKHALALLLFLASIAGFGYFGEYSIQRYGAVLRGYLCMVISLFVSVLLCRLLYNSCAPEPDYYD